MARGAALAALALSIVLGCGTGDSPTSRSSEGPAPTASASASLRPGPEGLVAADLARLEEAWRLVETHGPELWDGWGRERPPLLLQIGDADYLVGHPSPPDGFEPVAGRAVAGRPVLRREGHLARGIGVQQLGNRPGVALLRRADLQAFLDDVLGARVVSLDDVQYVRWAVHEAFHVYQFERFAMDLPRFGFEGDEMEEVARLEGLDGFARRLDDEGRLLRAALAAKDDRDLRLKLGAFLAERESRRASAPSGVASFEQAIEWSEGLARYTDVKVLQAAGRDDAPSSSFSALGAGYAEPEETWQAAIAWLDRLSSVPGTLRDRYYELGAGQAYALDRLMPGWQARAFPGGESIDSLLESGLAAADLGIPPTLRTLGVLDVRVADRMYRVSVADDAASWTRGLAGVDDLGPLDGLLFEFPGPVDARFSMQGATIPLDIAFFDAGGACLRVVKMPLCGSDPCQAYGSPAPFRWALEVPAGSLAGARPGDRLTVPAD
jgi:uncharacterized membrane protein (UPF0127 family)